MAPTNFKGSSGLQGNPSSSTSSTSVPQQNNAGPDWVIPMNLLKNGGGDPSASTSTSTMPQPNNHNVDEDMDVGEFFRGAGGNPDKALQSFLRSGGNIEALENRLRRRGNPSSSINRYLTLHRAALKGDWEEAKRFLDGEPSGASAIVTDFSMTALHVAAFEGHSEFVENMVRVMQPKDLETQDTSGRTALHYAALTGRLEAAKALVEKNPSLTNIVDEKGWTPLLHAATYGSQSKDLVWYLSLVTNDEEPSRPFTGPNAGDLVTILTSSGCLDVLLNVIGRYPTITAGENNPLLTMAQTPSNFLSGTSLGFWERCLYSLSGLIVIPVQRSIRPPLLVRSIMDDPKLGSQHVSGILSPTSNDPHADQVLIRGLQFIRSLLFSAFEQIITTPRCIKRLQDAKLKHQCAMEIVKQACTEIRDPLILISAAKRGIVEIFRIYFQLCPDVIWSSPKENYLLLIAIRHRQEKIFNLFCEKNARNKLNFSNLLANSDTVSHLAAYLAPYHQLSSVSGAALQMQKEVQWFKAMEKLVHPGLMEYPNEDGKTARELFTEEHKALAEAGEKWMKDTSNSCMIVSTLIATFVFAAAFTVPGGSNDDGIPLFLWSRSFLVFAISDSLSLFSSLTSLLMFLSILTARFAEEDFLRSLPKRLIIGLTCLFLAIATMMAAFGAAVYIMLNKRLKWISAPITLLTSFPVAIFVLQQLPLFIQMVKSTFGSTFRRQSFW